MKNLTNTQVQLLTYLTCLIRRLVLGEKKMKRVQRSTKKIVFELYRVFRALDAPPKEHMRQELDSLGKKWTGTKEESMSFSSYGSFLMSIFVGHSPAAVNYVLSRESFILGFLWWRIFTEEDMDPSKFEEEVTFLLTCVGKDQDRNFRRMDSAFRLARRIIESSGK